MICAAQQMPATPTPLLPAAAMVPATCVPWPKSSAGTIAAAGNNGVGVAGICWAAQIMPVKFLGPSGSGYTSDAIRAVLYATDMGARVMNNSWGGGGYSEALRDAVVAAYEANVLFVAAAGNSSSNADLVPLYPAAY